MADAGTSARRGRRGRVRIPERCDERAARAAALRAVRELLGAARAAASRRRDARGGGRARAARGDGRRRHLHGAARHVLGGRPRPARARHLVLLPGARRRGTGAAAAGVGRPRGGLAAARAAAPRDGGQRVLAFDHDRHPGATPASGWRTSSSTRTWRGACCPRRSRCRSCGASTRPASAARSSRTTSAASRSGGACWPRPASGATGGRPAALYRFADRRPLILAQSARYRRSG